MLDVVLHTGTTHPELDWIVASSILTFAAGLGLGLSAGRIRSWLAERTAAVGE